MTLRHVLGWQNTKSGLPVTEENLVLRTLYAGKTDSTVVNVGQRLEYSKREKRRYVVRMALNISIRIRINARLTLKANTTSIFAVGGIQL